MRFLDYARNDKRRSTTKKMFNVVISTKRSAWRDLMRFLGLAKRQSRALDYARNDKRRSTTLDMTGSVSIHKAKRLKIKAKRLKIKA